LKTNTTKTTLIDGSKIITEAIVRAGADVFIGYPITPSNLFYSYGQKRFPSFYAAPDEISVLQWMAGFSAAGKLPVTATAFPGLALMVESLNMAYMMELPMVLIIVQRLGPSTGSATTGAQGDLAVLNGIISGGYPLPVFCPSDFEDAWELAEKSVKTAIEFRTPVILLTSKEMIMTNKSFDLSKLTEIKKVVKPELKLNGEYKPYKPGKDLVPPFLPVSNTEYQVRINASTHDYEGMIRKNSPESLGNTKRLKAKFDKRIDELTLYDYDKEEGADKLIVTYGISTDAVRDALEEMRNKGQKVSMLTMKTLIPVSDEVMDIMDSYKEVIFVEENITGQLKEMIYGKRNYKHIKKVNKIGSMIDPHEIINEVL
jgi:2-oxoglutarate ferredoxin oxidoreductase subunit alpha